MRMSEHIPETESPGKPKKRKLRYPRTSNACNFCRKRKVRCTGTKPCEVCMREEVSCEYANGLAPNASSPVNEVRHTPYRASPLTSISQPNSSTTALDSNLDSSRPTSRGAAYSCRNSLEPPQIFTHGHHVGQNAGVSFLYGSWEKGQNQERTIGLQANNDNGTIALPCPLISFGDIPQIDPETLSSLPEPTFTIEQVYGLLERYFQYISPTYRFLHHPTVKKWAQAYLNQDKGVTTAQKAVVLLICAQTLLHSPVSPGVAEVGKGDVRMSISCSERAKALLDKEYGPPSLASVQARIGMCLYFLSTFRLNEARYCFSFAMSIATALGIHRRQSSLARGVSLIDAECRKRAFWSAYVLDGYLSVMLGRPRLIRDEDIDQPFPENIADHDLISSESEALENLPRHGNLEAMLAHAKLAKLLVRGNDQLYPLHSLTMDQILDRSSVMVDALSDWENNLPGFLKPKPKTMTGQRGFERQNTILKLGVAHVRILATRRCLLMDFGHPQTRSILHTQEASAKRIIKECVLAIIMILDTVIALIEHGQCYGFFWTTQYFALVAISTLYVLLIQGMRNALPGDIENLLDVDECLSKAKYCHDHLATLPPPGSQAEHHHVLLAHLRSKVEKSLSKRRNPHSYLSTQVGKTDGIASRLTNQADSQQTMTSVANLNNSSSNPPPTTSTLQRPAQQLMSPNGMNFLAGQDGLDDLGAFSLMLTPNSNSDSSFQYLPDFGWESLDTIGANMGGQQTYSFRM